MTTVTVLSRMGRSSLAREDVTRLDGLADVRYRALDQPPGRAEAVMLLRGTQILAATNRCLPELDATLLPAAHAATSARSGSSNLVTVRPERVRMRSTASCIPASFDGSCR